MHTVIRAIVYGNDVGEGLEEAKRVFQQLCDSSTFDYFVTFDEAGSVVSGKGRWGELPAICLVDSDEGKKLIEEGMDATKREFMRNVEMIRKVAAERTDEELFEEDFSTVPKTENEDQKDPFRMPFRFYCYEVGMYRGPNVWLYDADGEGIRSSAHLARVLAKWGEKKYEKLNVYIVPADVHF